MIDRYKKRFYKFDKESKGFITTVDVQQVLEVSYLLLNILDWKKILLLFVPSSHYFLATIITFIFFYKYVSLNSIMLVKISCTKNKM